MAKIGEITTLERFKARKCSQCGQWFYYERKTKIYCGDACRQQSKRGIEPDDTNPNNLTGREQLASIIAINNPKAYKQLDTIKQKYGFRAVQMCLDVIASLNE